MSDRKTPEERANDYERTQSTFMGQQKTFQAFLAGYAEGKSDGRADFIKNELPKLLEMARIGYRGEFDYEIPDLLAMAEKGEV